MLSEKDLDKMCENERTLVFLSTHSSQDKVGLFLFCFFLGGSSKCVPFRLLVVTGVTVGILSIADGGTIG